MAAAAVCWQREVTRPQLAIFLHEIHQRTSASNAGPRNVGAGQPMGLTAYSLILRSRPVGAAAVAWRVYSKIESENTFVVRRTPYLAS
jgi:hypothetical protein